MPQNTTRGFPYPVGTDRVMDGDDAIRALAEAVDTRIGLVKNGNLSVTPTAANTTTTVAVTFPTAFPVGVTPNVALTLGATTNAPGSLSYWCSGITVTGFNVNVQRVNTNGVPIQWLANG